MAQPIRDIIKPLSEDATWQDMVSLAFVVAAHAHHGQTRQDGEPYINHPVRLQQRCLREYPAKYDGQCIALLHDVLEDTAVTAEDLEYWGFHNRIIESIGVLTNTPTNDDQKSNAYIEGIAERYVKGVGDSSKRWPLIIKIFKVEDNLNITALSTLTAKDLARVNKYHNALLLLRRLRRPHLI